MKSEEDLYSDLPDDPELAFLYLESGFRETCESELNIQDGAPSSLCYVAYITKVLAAIAELGLEAPFKTQPLPSIASADFSTYSEFRRDVDHYITTLRIRHGLRSKRFSVKFDQATKVKIRRYLDKIREVVDKLEVEQLKKDALYSRLNALADEVNRDRTRFEVYGAMAVAAAGVLGDMAEKAEPVRKWLESIGKLIWGAKEDEDMQRLAPPPKRKALPGPAAQGAKEAKGGPDDDDIPF
ncbi:MAG: hypothetical protein ACLQME_02515 [Alphaproteobacteria bacterium]